MHKEIGIDLGSATMLVSTAEEGIIASEPSVIAIGRDNHRMYYFGEEAEKASRDAAQNLRLIHPLREGIVANEEATRMMITHALRRTCGNLIIKPRVLIGIPFGISEDEENLIEWTAAHAGARETFLVYTPVAALVGLGIPVDSAVMIVDIGAAGTSLMLTGGGKILYKNTVSVGGDSFSAAIVAYLLRTHKMKISTRSAEVDKKKIGTVWINRENRSLDIKGKRVDNGEMMTVRLSSQEMFEALEEPTAHLLAAVCEAIGEIPSQFVGEIFHRGILLCGGGACLDGLDKMISGVTGVNARVVDLPDEVVALGLGKILADLPTSMKNEKINVSQRCMRAEF